MVQRLQNLITFAGVDLPKSIGGLIVKIPAFALIMALLVPVPNGYALEWGTEFVGSSWKMDNKEFATSANNWINYGTKYGFPVSAKTTRESVGGQLSVFVEGGAVVRFGGAIGYGVMPDVSYEMTNTNLSTYDEWEKFTNTTKFIPLDLYVKYNVGKLHVSAGAGADYIMAKTEYDSRDYISGTEQSGTFKQNKFVPHLQAGGEWRVLKWLSLSVSAKYLFGAVLDNLKGNFDNTAGEYKLIMDDDGEGYWADFEGPLGSAANGRPFKYDYSGLRLNAGLRIYFN